VKKEKFLILKVREGKKQKEKTKSLLTLTPHEDGFLKNLIKKEVCAYA